MTEYTLIIARDPAFSMADDRIVNAGSPEFMLHDPITP